MRSTKSPSWIERLLGLDPQPAPPWVFGLGAETLRLARLDRDDSGAATLSVVHEAALPPDVFQSGPLGGPLRAAEELDGVIQALLQRVQEPVEAASLVLPDRWLRVVITELENLPTRGRERDEMLRWKLRRLVPFRVEELRLRAVALGRTGAGEPGPVLLGFGIELLLDQLERRFEAAGVHVGRITNESLGTAGALSERLVDGRTLLLVDVEQQGYALTLLRDRVPLLYRFKTLEPTMPREALGRMVRRELALTSSFLAERSSELVVEHALLAAPPESEADWLVWIGDAIGSADALAPEHLGARVHTGVALSDSTPLLGAALEAVA